MTALHGHGHLDEVTGLSPEIGQPSKRRTSRCGRVGEAQLRHGEWSGQIAEVALLFDMVGNVD